MADPDLGVIKREHIYILYMYMHIYFASLGNIFNTVSQPLGPLAPVWSKNNGAPFPRSATANNKATDFGKE